MPYVDPAVQNAYQRRRLAARRRAWLEVNGPCVQCGSTVNLEVDHIDPATKVDHKVWSWRRERREAELAKCQVLCVRCHRAKSLVESPPPRRPQIHGVRSYLKRRCRCASCIAAYEAYKARRANLLSPLKDKE